MHVLITGGAGFIGMRVAKAFLDRGWNVTILDLAPDQPADWWTDPKVKVVQGDIRHPETVASVMKDVDAVWHLAAAHHDTGIDTQTYFSVNEAGTKVLCDEMARQGVLDLCFYSSVAVYGMTENRETLTPANPYGESKLAAEKVIEEWAKEGDRKALMVRPVVIFGPENFANMYALIRQIDLGVYWPVGPGENVKSMAYVGNIVPTSIDRWLEMRAGEVHAANYADKPDLKSREIADTLFQALGRKSRSPAIPLKPAQMLLKGFDSVYTRIRGGSGIWMKVEKFAVSHTQYTTDFPSQPDDPRISLQEGLTEMARWYKAHGKNFTPRKAIPPAQVQEESRSWSPA